MVKKLMHIQTVRNVMKLHVLWFHVFYDMNVR